MISPRLEIDLDKIRHNAITLVRRMASLGISVTGITKTTLGSPEIANTLVQAGITTLGDSRIENIMTMLESGLNSTFMLIRSPMLSQVDLVVQHADISFNTDLDVIRKLSVAARKANRNHGVVLMVELGDLREGIMLDDFEDIVRETLRLPNLIFKGIGTNLACQSGVKPDNENMAKLSTLTESIESTFNLSVNIVSGGNSANLPWALNGVNTGRINNLRLGESILLGREPLHRKPIDGLFTDAFTIVAEVIESKIKPSLPWGEVAQTAFVEKPKTPKSGTISHVIFALGRQDTDPHGLTPTIDIEILGASGDHLIVDGHDHNLKVGTEVCFQPNYSALLRAMTSPFVTKVMKPSTSDVVKSE